MWAYTYECVGCYYGAIPRADEAKDDVLMAWHTLKLKKGETMQHCIDKFWDLHLKAIVFEKIKFSKQK